MIRKRIKIGKCLFIIVLLILTLLFVYNLTYRKKRKVQIETYNLSIKSVYSSNEEISYEMDSTILYNNIMIPLDVVLKDIFGKVYNEDNGQIILEIQNQKYIINQEENVIQIPNEYEYKGNILNNSITVEIEKIKDKSYIPIYFIANIPGAKVYANGKRLYESTNYISSSDIISKNKNNNLNIQIEISKTKTDESNEVYWGQKKGTLWREEAFKRIEKYRKKDISIHVINSKNKKEIKAKININMKNNSFDYGTSIAYDNSSKKNIIGNLDLFSIIGSENGFKWKVYENTNYVSEIMEYANKNSKKVRGHNLWWDYIYSNELRELVGREDKYNEGSMADIYYKNKSGELNEDEIKLEIEKLKEKFEKIVINHITKEIKDFKDVKEWDVINGPLKNQYFKYYLFEENFLKDDEFLKVDYKTFEGNEEYKINEEYSKFLAKCIDTVKNEEPNNKAIINDNIITDNASNMQLENTIELLNSISQYTNNKFSYGIQYHVYNNYINSIQNYYNILNEIKRRTKIEDIVITEYDNVLESKKGNYSTSENKIRAKYLRDSLIMAYSNTNISEFTMWVYNSSNFCNEERKAYEETVNPWLNYSEDGSTTENGYATRLYTGTYIARITLPNGKTNDMEFKVLNDTSDKIELMLDSEVTDIRIKQKPSKTEYYRNDNIDLTDGILEIIYDDGTTSELKMNDSNIKILGFDSSNIGKKKLTIKYENKETYYEVNVIESVENSIKAITDNLTKKNEKLKENYPKIEDKKYQNILNSIENLNSDINNNNKDRIEKLYEQQINIANDITTKYINNQVTIDASELNKCITDILAISDDYKELYKYYVTEDIIENSTVKEKLNGVIDKYNNNTDIDLSKVTDLINTTREIYNTSINTDNVSDNYLNKQRILKTCEIINLIIDNDIRKAADEDSNNVTISYNVNVNIPTNQDVYVTVNLPTDKAIIVNNEQNAPYIFKENGTKTITINIRGYEYTYNISIKNIDKTAPKIDNVEQLNNSVTPQISDDNFQNVELKLDGNLKLEYQVGQTITTPGMYSLTAKDKAGNVTTTNFIIYDTYNENNQKINYVPIYNVTTLKNLKNNINMQYTITKNNQEINENDYISTGCEIQINNKKYYLIVKGDINGDGKVTGSDLVKVRRYLIGLETFTPVEKVGAILSQRNDVSINDLAKMRKIILQ